MPKRPRSASALPATSASAKLAATVLALCAGLTVAPCASATAAEPATTTGTVTSATTLGLAGYSSIAVDSVHGHVFVSGTSNDPVAVTNFSDAPVATLSFLTGASSLTLSTNSAILYAAIAGTDEIAAVNTATLQEVAVYYTGTDYDPVHLATIGHNIWFSYDNNTTGIGELQPTAVPTVTTYDQNTSFLSGAPLLAASPAAPNTLIAGDQGGSPSVVESFDVASGAPVEIATSDPWSQPDGCENLGGLAIASSTDVILACGYPYYGSSLAISTMTEDFEYQTGQNPESVAVSAKGTIAIGVALPSNSSNVDLFTPGSSAPATTYQLSAADLVGLAWASNGNKLFAVTSASNYGTAPSLHVLKVS